MTDHPLTDEILRDILEAVAKETEEDYSGWFEDDLMRAAADWQLEQDAKFFAQYLIKNEAFAPTVAELRAEWFKEAMRSQRQEDN